MHTLQGGKKRTCFTRSSCDKMGATPAFAVIGLGKVGQFEKSGEGLDDVMVLIKSQWRNDFDHLLQQFILSSIFKFWFVDLAFALGIGIQNFPEGLAVSMPLMREGVSPLKAFWYGQLSGLVEPLGGVLGAAFVHYCRPMLPYTMSLAAGAMIFVVCDSLVPEMQAHGNKALAMQGLMLGFVVMMVLDVALG